MENQSPVICARNGEKSKERETSSTDKRVEFLNNVEM